MTRVLVVATSRKTRGGITAVVKAHETGEQWKKYHCRWIETHRDGPAWRKIWYFVTALTEYVMLLPFYDIIHIHTGLRTSIKRKIVFAKIAKIFNRKIIIHFHPSTEKHLFDPCLSKDIKYLFDISNCLIVLTSQWKNWINEAFPQNQYNIRVLYNPCPVVERKKGDSSEQYILYAGILSERKGYDRLLEAFSYIARDYPDWKIKFAGNGEIEQAKAKQKQLGIQDNQVEYLGWISGEKKDIVFKNATIYCLPSWGEGFSMGVLDAMAYGIPVVTTPVGGITEILHHGESGFIYDTYNLHELTNYLKKLMDSPALRKSMVVHADKQKEILLNIQKICKQLDSIYANLSNK